MPLSISPSCAAALLPYHKGLPWRLQVAISTYTVLCKNCSLLPHCETHPKGWFTLVESAEFSCKGKQSFSQGHTENRVCDSLQLSAAGQNSAEKFNTAPQVSVTLCFYAVHKKFFFAKQYHEKQALFALKNVLPNKQVHSRNLNIALVHSACTDVRGEVVNLWNKV